MKFYIAASFGEKERVKVLFDGLRAKGHDVSLDWTTHKSIRPYGENKGLAETYSVDDVKGASECDVFILLTDETGRGMFVEFGIALLSKVKMGKPEIFIVGANREDSVFYFHPQVQRRVTVEKVLEEVGV